MTADDRERPWPNGTHNGINPEISYEDYLRLQREGQISWMWGDSKEDFRQWQRCQKARNHESN